MAVKIRLTRTGATNDACYRVVAADSRSPRDGRNLEILGWYDPGMTDHNFNVKLDRVDHWISQGAQVSDTVASLLRKARRGESATSTKPDAAPAAPAAPVEAPAEAVAEEAPAESSEEPAEGSEDSESESVSKKTAEEAPATADAG